VTALNTDLNGIKAIFFDAGGTLIHLDSARIADLINDEHSYSHCPFLW
jgi:FMN phosphatase YigB (HAD superfamily)